jgi:hypothetical protein
MEQWNSQVSFDTHGGEMELLTNLYGDLADAIWSFAQNLKQSGHWKETLVFVYSDFGRTIILPESWTRGLVKKSLNLTKRYDQTNPTQIHA